MLTLTVALLCLVAAILAGTKYYESNSMVNMYLFLFVVTVLAAAVNLHDYLTKTIEKALNRWYKRLEDFK